MKTKWLFIIAAIALVISTVAVKPAMAFFTDTIQTQGGFKISVGDGVPEIHEDVENLTKKVTIRNVGDYPIFVRAKAIYPDNCDVTFTVTEGWSDGGDGYYYYADPIVPGESTPEDFPLTLKITRNAGETGTFNVIIVQEATKVAYDENGNVIWAPEAISQSNYNLGQ